MKAKDINSLDDTSWRCQYHVVFAPKYRRLAIYSEIKVNIGKILRQLCQQKGIEIIEAELCPDHIHIYTDYDEQSYNVIVACEVSEADFIPENTIMRIIPAGKYAKFVVVGDMVKAVSESWNEIWQMDLPRSYEYDFEEYQNSDTENAEVHIYLSLK